jgi:hypothetical protein
MTYLHYNAQTLHAATANCMAECYRKILAAAVETPKRTIKNMID